MKHEVVYKKVKVAMPHCSVCGERLIGNNSQMSPYSCSCGTWLGNWLTGEYSIVPKPTQPSREGR